MAEDLNGSHPQEIDSEETPSGELISLTPILNAISDRLMTLGHLDVIREEIQESAREENLQTMIFQLGGIHYSIDIRNIREILQEFPITQIPGTPSWLAGATNFHGDILPVIYLADFLELNKHESGHPSLMVVSQDNLDIGLIVNQVDVIYSFPGTQITTPPISTPEHISELLQGVIERNAELVHIIDCGQLITSTKLQQFAR